MAFPFFNNIAGTLRNAFRIGTGGPSIRQGEANPNTAPVAGVDGDIYIQHDTAEMFQRRGGVWINIGGEGFSRTAVTSASYTIQPTDHYIGVNFDGPVEIYLPAGIENKQFVIKDESGLANDTDRTITVIADGFETIDGDPEMVLTVGYVSITLVYGSEWHLI